MAKRVHRSYGSIVSPGTEAFARIADGTSRYGAVEWLATEKLHGSNFCMVAQRHTDGTIDTYCCRRRGILREEDRFYNAYAILKRYRKALLAVLDEVHGEKECRVLVYGELVGGFYPGNPPGDWQSLHEGEPIRVQAGIHYCPHNDFFAFDLHDGERYFDFDSAKELLTTAGFLSVNILARGSFDDMVKLNPHFETTIPARFGLPPAPDNIAEGYVIRPVSGRALVKLKNARFAEISRCSYAKARVRKPKVPDSLSDALATAVEELGRYMTSNRLDNVVSKEGAGIVPPAKLGGLLAQDALKDFRVRDDNMFSQLTTDEQKRLRKMAVALASSTVQAYATPAGNS